MEKFKDNEGVEMQWKRTLTRKWETTPRYDKVLIIRNMMV